VTYSGGDGLTGRVGGTTPGYDYQAVSEGRHGVDSSLIRAPALCRNIKCSGRWSGCGSCEPARASSEAESHPRGRPALERGGVSPEGAPSPRARRNTTRGGVRPSSEAESHPRGRPALERGGVSPEGAPSPRVRWSLGDMAAYPSSKVGFRSRGAGADRFGGPPRLLSAMGPCHRVVIVLGVIYNL
jgi:hypothetical protein